MDFKICSKCGEQKSITEFGKSKSHTGGYYCHCKSCVKAHNREQYINNRERRLEKQKLYGANNKESKKLYDAKYRADNRMVIAAKKREWCENNREYKREVDRKYRLVNSEIKKQYYRNFYREHRERYYGYAAKRRAQEISSTPQWANITLIAECYSEASRLRALGSNVHVDHIVPLKAVDERGNHIASGLHNEFNLQIVPAEYNLRKNNRFYGEFANPY